MTICPTCGAPCGPSLSAILADQGHDPLEHCEIAAIYAGKPTVPCIGQGHGRQCHLCKIGQALGISGVMLGFFARAVVGR